MGAIEEMRSLTPSRPQFGFDKQHIIDTARLIGKYRLSMAVKVCDAHGPKKTDNCGEQRMALIK